MVTMRIFLRNGLRDNRHKLKEVSIWIEENLLHFEDDKILEQAAQREYKL